MLIDKLPILWPSLNRSAHGASDGLSMVAPHLMADSMFSRYSLFSSWLSWSPLRQMIENMILWSETSWFPLKTHGKSHEINWTTYGFDGVSHAEPHAPYVLSGCFHVIPGAEELAWVWRWHEMTHGFQHNYANSNETNYILWTNAIINSSMKNIKFSFQPTLLTPSHPHLLHRWATAWKFSRTYRGWWFGSQAMPSSDSKDDSLIGWNLIGAHSICW